MPPENRQNRWRYVGVHSSACEGDRRGSPISGQARLTMELDLTAWHPIFEPLISAVPLKGAVFLFAVRSSHSRHGHRGPPSAISRCTVTETRVRSTVTSCRLNFSRMVHEPGARRAASSTRVRPRAERRAHESSPATDLQRPAEHRSRAELSGAPPPVVKPVMTRVTRRVLTAVTHSRAQASTQHSHNHARHTEASLL